MEEIMIDLLNGFNFFFIILFQYIKYIFAFILLILGILTLLSLRKIYFDKKLSNNNVNEDFLRKLRLVVGSVYIILGSGILFNYFIYFLILILNPLPDQFIQSIIIDSIIKNLDLKEEEYVLTLINDCFSNFFAIGSFFALFFLFMSLWYLLNNRHLKDPHNALKMLIGSIASGIIFGFSTCLPYFL